MPNTITHEKQSSEEALLRPWSPIKPAIYSLFIPGFGQFYNEQYGVGITFLLLTPVAYALGFPLGLIVHISAIYHAYKSVPLKPADYVQPTVGRLLSNTLLRRLVAVFLGVPLILALVVLILRPFLIRN